MVKLLIVVVLSFVLGGSVQHVDAYAPARNAGEVWQAKADEIVALWSVD